MEKELEILQQIQDNEYITQRDLAESTGLSLGGVNLLLKKLINKGFVMIERLNPQKIRYILTPTGMAEKTAKTYNYIVKTYNNMLHMQAIIQAVLDKQLKKGVEKVYLYGQEDEVYQMIKIVLDKLCEEKSIKYKKIEHLENIKINDLVIVWEDENESLFDSKNISNINIIKYL
jgi:DNA-binding MarR family transcriptional regulator